jgi:two-component system CheB/CheR fusion protein
MTTPTRPDEPARDEDGRDEDGRDRAAASGASGAESGGPPTPEAPALIVGIGTSAGGLESLKRFLGALPVVDWMGFVVVQHLQPGRPSRMDEVIAHFTQLPVTTARDGVAVRGGHVHVMPEDTLLTIDQGCLRVEQTGGDMPRPMRIDTFLRALAADQGRRAVGIVMSGAGSDGALGVREIKAAGGLTLAESMTARRQEASGFDSMPRSAAATGAVDFLVPAGDMPRYLLDYADHLHAMGGLIPAEPADGEPSDAAPPTAVAREIETALMDICAVLLARKGRDFRQYKPSTLVRRIERRMQVLRIATAADYLARLRADGEELERLSWDLLISVTRFFRDPEAFDALKADVLHPLVRACDADQAVRVWVPGCGTGEEAYSIAILLLELRQELERFPKLQIFATDIDPRAIEMARAGRYPKSIDADVSAARLDRFFQAEEETYRVHKEVREICIFSEHDLIQSPPFSQLDLISCRNVLIYLDGNLQKRLIPIFHYALRAGGFLFLGASEYVAHAPELFTVVDKRHRLFRRQDQAARPKLEFPAPAASAASTAPPPPGPPAADRAQGEREAVVARVEETLRARYVPPYVVVDDNQTIVRFSSGTGPFLEAPAGEPRDNLLDMVRPSLRAGVRAALTKAARGEGPVVQPGVADTPDGGEGPTSVVVTPVSGQRARPLYIVAFESREREIGAPRAPAATGRPAAAADRVRALERELAQTREDLQATIEELETSNEELQSTNEEMHSMNEELQSSNEELETSKEEVQSVNEELQTVNDELQHKYQELNRTHANLKNLLSSTDIASVFLDRELRIRWYTPAAQRLFSLIETDLGRPIGDLTAHFEHAALLDDLRAVLVHQDRREREVIQPDSGRVFTLRVLPYEDTEGRPDGLVMTFQDITRLKAAERESAERAREAEAALARLRLLLDVVPAGIVIADGAAPPRLDINPAAAELLGVAATRGDPEGLAASDVCLVDETADARPRAWPLFEVLRTGRPMPEREARLARPGQPGTDVMVGAAPVTRPDGTISGSIMVLVDIGRVKAAERRQRHLLEALQQRVRDILGMARWLSRETRDRSADLDGFFERFEGRLGALATTETIVARTSHGQVDFAELVDEVVQPELHGGDSVRANGPSVLLPPRPAQLLALALNELTLNALTHGALTTGTGRIAVTWQVDAAAAASVSGSATATRADGWLTLHWTETGGPPPTAGASQARGFGRTLLETTLPRTLAARPRVTFTTEGVTVAIEVPLTSADPPERA